MPEILAIALDVKELDGIAAQLEATNQRVRALTDWAIRAPGLVRSQWIQLVNYGIDGHVAEVQQVRDRFCSDVQRRIKYVEQIYLLAKISAQGLGQAFPGSELLNAERELRAIANDICDRWHTVEDLEDLLVKYFPLSEQELADIVKRNPPPAAWYEQSEKPF
jgi:hypothetical protein